MRCPEAPSSDQLHPDTSVHALRLWFLVKHMSDSSYYHSAALNNYSYTKNVPMPTHKRAFDCRILD